MNTAAELGLDPGRLLRAYQRDAMVYSRTLSEENLMESSAQATQRKITLESFDVIRVRRPDIQCFNEILIQYPRPGENPEKPGRVVPDNMIVVHPEPIENIGSYMMPIQKVVPTLVMEYVSDSNTRKDYQKSYEKYEEFVQAPYYLVFDPDEQKLNVFRLARGKYLQLLPNAEGRLPISELELEVAVLDGWVRFWFRDELVPLPSDLVEAHEDERRKRILAEQRASVAEQRAAEAEAELARLRSTFPTPK